SKIFSILPQIAQICPSGEFPSLCLSIAIAETGAIIMTQICKYRSCGAGAGNKKYQKKHHK
ncbi:MAG: hypothetical protein Q4D23_03850, partial [Bacteroidales bacterium]|nr:hypothetical protein [Bacteroidales bacterium]